jgi:hypothetical protein
MEASLGLPELEALLKGAVGFRVVDTGPCMIKGFCQMEGHIESGILLSSPWIRLRVVFS